MIYIKLFLSLVILIVLFYFSFFVFTKENFEVTTSSYIDKIDDNQILDIYNVKSKCKDLEKNNFEIDYDNAFKYILDNTFIKVPNLERINLKNQMIDALNSHTFNKLEKLNSLKLSGNNLKVIGSNIFHNNLGLKKSNISELQIFYENDRSNYEKIIIVVYPETIIRLSMLGIYRELNGICYSNIEDNEEKIYDLLYKMRAYNELIKRLLGVDESYLGDFKIPINNDKSFNEIFRLVYYKDIFYNTDTAHWRKRFEKYTPVTTGSLQERSYSINNFCVYDNKYDNKYLSCIDLYQKIVEYKAIVEENKAVLDSFKYYGGGNLELKQNKEKYEYYRNLLPLFINTNIPQYIINAMIEFGNIDAENNCHLYNLCKNKNEWKGETGFLKEIDESEYLSDRIPTLLSQELEQTHPIELSADNKSIINNQPLPSCQSNLIEGFNSDSNTSLQTIECDGTSLGGCGESLQNKCPDSLNIKIYGDYVEENWLEYTYFANSESCASTKLHITITNSIKIIKKEAFNYYNYQNIVSVTFEPNSQLETIGENAFRGCKSLTSLTLPNSVKEIGESAFRGCSSLTSLIIPNSVISIGIKAFRYCTSLKSLTIPNSVTTIDEDAFLKCESLESLTIPSSVTSIGMAAFKYCKSLKSLTFESNSSLESIGPSAFYECLSLESLTIPDSVTSIGRFAFYECLALESLTIPNSVTTIGRNAFYNSFNLESITFQPSSPNQTTTMSIDKFAFALRRDGIIVNNDKVSELIIPNYITSIDEGAFRNFTAIKTLIFRPNSRLETIGNYAFHTCSTITSLTIPNSVKEIGVEAFYNSFNLESITFQQSSPNQTTTMTIDNFAFALRRDGIIVNNDKVSELIIPNYIKKIGVGTFRNFTALETLIFRPNSRLETIGNYAFRTCSTITSLTIPNSVTSIGRNAFYNSFNLESITFQPSSPNQTTTMSIDKFAFALRRDGIIVNNDKVSELIIPNYITSIDEGAFRHFTALESLTFEEGSRLDSIAKDVFFNCTSLRNIKRIPIGVTIHPDAFKNCGCISSSIGCNFQPGDTIIDCKKVKCNTYAIENKHFLGLKRKIICADYVMRADDLYTLMHQTEEERFNRLIKKITIAGQNQNDQNILKEIKLANLLHNLEIQGDQVEDDCVKTTSVMP